nr:IucA/IucC family protein [Micromonospora sp. DSM 115978]
MSASGAAVATGGQRRAVCGCATGIGTLREAAAVVARHLGLLAPELVDRYRAALPRAAAAVAARLVGALWREDVAGARSRPAPPGRRHAFDRVDVPAAAWGGALVDPVDLLPAAVLDRAGWALAAELTNAVVNLAVALARAGGGGYPPVAGLAPDVAALGVERLAVYGHNLHPCGRTRLGWDVADVLAHDLEADRSWVGFVAVPREVFVGDDVGAALARVYPQVPAAPPGHVCQPVHGWQMAGVLRRHPGLRRLDGTLPVWPTAALRTVLLPAGADGRHRYLKLSLDIQVTSTRRTISVASTRNGPAIWGVLARLLADDPAGGRVLLLPETAGAAVTAGSGRDASVILRGGLDGRLEPGEQVVPGAALPAGSVLGDLVDRYARTRSVAGAPAAALGFVTEYAGLLLPPLLRLTTRYGVAVEAHLQNCLPTFVDGVPHRMVLRDFAGPRLHLPRLAAAGVAPRLWPGSVTGTTDLTVLRAKIGYTALQAHLGELVVRLTGSHGLDEVAAWRAVRAVVDQTYEPLRAAPDRRLAAAAAADHAALTAARVPHKALVRMRLAGSGDVHVAVVNPLADG